MNPQTTLTEKFTGMRPNVEDHERLKAVACIPLVSILFIAFHLHNTMGVHPFPLGALLVIQ
jgi:hypothetical protein